MSVEVPYYHAGYLRLCSRKLTMGRCMQIHADAAQMPAEVGGQAGDKLHFHWVKGMFDGATQALTDGLESLCSFIGIKVQHQPVKTVRRMKRCLSTAV